jgi:hypothetical protein
MHTILHVVFVWLFTLDCINAYEMQDTASYVGCHAILHSPQRSKHTLGCIEQY